MAEPADRRHVTLSEYGSTVVALSRDEGATLKRLAGRALTVEPVWGDEEMYQIEATSFVGTIDLDDVVIQIFPKVGIGRLLFLLAYAMNPRDWEALESDFEPQPSLLETILPAFVKQVGSATEQGLLRGYRREETALQGIRGRVRFDDQLRRRFAVFPPAEVTYDEFDEDIEENRLIKAATARLGRMRLRTEAFRPLLRRIDTTLLEVSLINYDPSRIPQVAFTRLNQHYESALALARTILRNTSFDMELGSVRASAFLVDMNQVFETFVWTALRESLRLPRSVFPLGASGRRMYLDTDGRLRIKPDLSWWQGGRCMFVGDVKYKDLDTGPARENDLYQLNAYMTATALEAGILVYASRGPHQDGYRIAPLGLDAQVFGLGLSETPEIILKQVDVIATAVKEIASRSSSEAA